MRDRLIELLRTPVVEQHIAREMNYEQFVDAVYGSIADNLLANGVIAPPCKVGDTVYRLAHNKDRNEWRVADFWDVVKIEIYFDEIGFVDDSGNWFSTDEIGKTVFLTKEEAEKALKEREQSDR